MTKDIKTIFKNPVSTGEKDNMRKGEREEKPFGFSLRQHEGLTTDLFDNGCKQEHRGLIQILHTSFVMIISMNDRGLIGIRSSVVKMSTIKKL
jgi:hypothetical protein|tara:strand:+ start:81 stop:359 length:279 start_codon:yes stop_codon:yes gene_type:complete